MGEHDCFIAEVGDPARWRLRISHASMPGDWSRGWRLQTWALDAAGLEMPATDHFDETFLQILQYVPAFPEGPLQWRWESTGEAVDLAEIQPACDVPSVYERHAVITVSSADDSQRIYIGAYDDGSFRWALEERICIEGRSAWSHPRRSEPYPTASAAEAAARREFGQVFEGGGTKRLNMG